MIYLLRYGKKLQVSVGQGSKFILNYIKITKFGGEMIVKQYSSAPPVPALMQDLLVTTLELECYFVGFGFTSRYPESYSLIHSSGFRYTLPESILVPLFIKEISVVDLRNSIFYSYI